MLVRRRCRGHGRWGHCGRGHGRLITVIVVVLGRFVTVVVVVVLRGGDLAA